MPDQLDAAAAGGRRAADAVHGRPVVAHEVHVDGGDASHPPADVAREVERLHEHLGEHDGGPEVQVDAAVEVGDHAGEKAEVAQAALADGRACGVGMHVDDVGADGDVHGGGQAGARSRGEDAGGAMRQAGSLDRISHGTAEPLACRDAFTRGPVQELAGLARHAEEAAVEARTDVLRRAATPRHLEVVHQAGAVHRDRSQSAALDEVDDERTEPHLDGVRSHPEHDGAARADRARYAPSGVTQVARRQDVGEAGEERAHAGARAHRLAERRHGHLARAAAERNRAYAARIDGSRQASAPRALHAGSPQRRRSTSSHSTCPTRMGVSWMRGDSRLADTRRLTSTIPVSAPPSPPVSPTVRTPRERHADTAWSTLGELPLVDNASATSPARPSAMTWRAKTSP